jgi:acetyl-CoA carboxylase biotin carboxyl carrier protein
MPPRGKSKTSPPASSAKRAASPATGDAHIVDTVRGLAAVLAEHGLTEIIVDTPEATMTLRRGGISVASVPAMAPMPMVMPAAQPAFSAPASPAVAANEPAPVDDKAHVVTSPFVGSFYRKPNPDSAAYVQLNDKVNKGQVLCIVEAMKLMNEIEADLAGTVVAVLVEDGAAVEYGQPLFKIVP